MVAASTQGQMSGLARAMVQKSLLQSAMCKRCRRKRTKLE